MVHYECVHLNAFLYLMYKLVKTMSVLCSYTGVVAVMTKGRDNAAERLSDVIAVIRARRQSGVLSVEHYEAGRFEEGEIYFENGQPVQARLGTMSGQEALARLLKWRNVYFLFVKDAATEPQKAQVRSTEPVTLIPRSPLPSFPFVATNDKDANYELTQQPTLRQEIAQQTSQEVLVDAELATRVPQRVKDVKDVLSLPVTRAQRSIYMLIDGKRNIGDLSRCTHKSTQEIYWILTELRNRGYIAF